MTNLKASYEDFKDALQCLNEKLKDDNLSIEIKAIGGFAMLYNKLRLNGYTMDIDTVTKDLPQKVMKLINEVANEKNLDEDWINNDAYSLPEITEIIDKIGWKEDSSFSNIRLLIADIQSLLTLKIRAIDYAGLIPRVTDQTDLLDILSFLGIHSIEELSTNPLTKNIKIKYPRCYSFLIEKQDW
ncbi:MAG: hypothetical protein K6F27_09015 [Ruminococcus sp.]|nr:hypothetical protein [Ruminococcus sp.]